MAMLREQLPEGEIPEGAYLERAAGAYRGDNRTQGAWVWHVVTSDGIPLCKDSKGRPLAIGSQFTMTELVRTGFVANSFDYGDICIDPPDEVQSRQAP